MINQRSTPIKFPNFAEGNNMKTSRDVIYDELQLLKNETNDTFIATNNNINKIDNSVTETSKEIKILTGKIEKLIADQEEIKNENHILKTRCDGLEIRMKTFENVKEDYIVLKKKVEEIYVEVRERKSQSSLEDLIKKSLVESTDKIKSSMEDNMNRINNLFISNFTNQMVSDGKLYTSEPTVETGFPPQDLNKITQGSNIKPIPSNFSNKESPKAPEKSSLDNNNINVFQNASSVLDSNKSISKSSPLKDNNKNSISFNDNQNVNSAPGFSLFANKPACSPLGVSNLSNNQGNNSILGKQQTNLFNNSVDFNKSPTSGSLFSDKSSNKESLFGIKTQSNKLFGDISDPTKSVTQTNSLFGNNSSNKESLFGIKTQLFGDISEPTKSVTQTNSLFGNKAQPNKLFGDISDPTKSINQGIFGTNTQKGNLFNSTDSNKSIINNQSKLDNVNKESSSSNNLFNVKPSGTDQSNKPLFSFTSAVNSNTPSFSSLSQSAADSKPFASSNSEATWQGGSKLFANNNKLNTSENEDNNNVEQNQDEEHDPHFQPIIDLPPLVALQKDEESHDILFKCRCKLYRFTGSEWKERGVGEMKVMRTKESIDPSRPVKLLMRRDQVRKICCNQRISKNVPTFAEMPNVKSTCWVGNDFSEGEPTQEKFAIRFSHVDELTKFKNIVEEIQAEISSADKTD